MFKQRNNACCWDGHRDAIDYPMSENEHNRLPFKTLLGDILEPNRDAGLIQSLHIYAGSTRYALLLDIP